MTTFWDSDAGEFVVYAAAILVVAFVARSLVTAFVLFALVLFWFGFRVAMKDDRYKKIVERAGNEYYANVSIRNILKKASRYAKKGKPRNPAPRDGAKAQNKRTTTTEEPEGTTQGRDAVEGEKRT